MPAWTRCPSIFDNIPSFPNRHSLDLCAHFGDIDCVTLRTSVHIRNSHNRTSWTFSSSETWQSQFVMYLLCWPYSVHVIQYWHLQHISTYRKVRFIGEHNHLRIHRAFTEHSIAKTIKECNQKSKEKKTSVITRPRSNNF